jgi:hypothetical protein
VKDENGGLLADLHIIVSRLLNVHRISDVRQTEIHTAQVLGLPHCKEEKV